MIYVPRGFQYINAIEFKGWSKSGEEISRFGLRSIPQGMNGSCDCGNPFNEHGLLNNQLVCPGIYILYEGNQVSSVMRKEAFEKIYKSIDEDVVADA